MAGFPFRMSHKPSRAGMTLSFLGNKNVSPNAHPAFAKQG